MSKIVLVALVIGIALYAYTLHIEQYFKEINKTLEATNLLLLQVKDNKNNTNERRLAKINANISAFQGLECARCHITNEQLLLPLANKPKLTQEDYIAIVRNGIEGKMGGFDEKSMPDNALKIQYRILEKLYK